MEAGAEFAITRPVFDSGELAQFLKRVERFRIPILAAVMPLESLRHTEFMANEVPGVRVPASVVERMRRADGAGEALSEGLAIARELAAETKSMVQGFQISSNGAGAETVPAKPGGASVVAAIFDGATEV